MKTAFRKTDRHNFTLVEMIAATAIMVFVALIIGTASMIFHSAWKRSSATAERLKRLQAIDRIMDSSVKNMYPFYWHDNDRNADRIVFKGDTDTISFASVRRAYSGDSGAFMFITLKCTDGRLVASYSPYPRTWWDADDGKDYPVREELIADKVRSVSFLYANEENDEIEWLDDWPEQDETGEDNADADNDRGFKLPMAVQLTVEWDDGTKEVWLRRVAGASKYSQLMPTQ